MNDFVTMTDQQLVEAVLGGFTTAYDVLCKRYESVLVGMLSGRGVVECDDIVQESFIKAYLNLDKYDPKYTFGQWIFAIAKNLHIDGIRKQKGTKVDIDEVVTFCGSMNPEQSFISRQSRDQMERRLERLPEGYRVIVELRFLDELSYDEIASKLGIPIGTVKTKIHRARALLVKQQ